MTQNEHVYAICCRLEVPGDVISDKMYRLSRAMLCSLSKLLSLLGLVSEIFQKKILFAAETDIDDSIEGKRIRVSL